MILSISSDMRSCASQEWIRSAAKSAMIDPKSVSRRPKSASSVDADEVVRSANCLNASKSSFEVELVVPGSDLILVGNLLHRLLI